MKKPFLALCVLLAAAVAFAAVSDAQTLPLSSRVYAEMDELYRIAGEGVPSNARPWSFSETRLILARVDRESLPGSGKTLYDDIEREVGSQLRWSMGEDASVGARFYFNPEIYTHSNEAFNQESDWFYGYNKRGHAIQLDLEMTVGKFFYTHCDLMYGYGILGQDDSSKGHFMDADDYLAALKAQDPSGIYDDDYIGSVDVSGKSVSVPLSYEFYTVPFLFNLPGTVNFDWRWPRRAVLQVGGANWSLGVGRDRLDWGNSHIGNFVIDDHVDYQNHLRFVAFADRFKYDFTALFLEADPNVSEVETEKVKMLLAHRLEFRFMPWLTFAISENVIYQTGTVDPAFLNPAYIYHNLNNRGMFNALAHVELDLQLFKGLNIYGQFCLDQAQAPNESDAQQGAWGALGGIEFTHGFEDAVYGTSLECAYTTPQLYRRDDVDFVMMKKTFVLGTSYASTFDFIGFPYGGDAIVVDWRNRLDFPTICEIDFGFRAAYHGEMTIFQSHNVDGNNEGFPNRPLKTLSGDKTIETYVANLGAKTVLNDWIGKFKWPLVKVFAELDFVHRQTHVKSSDAIVDPKDDWQFSAGLSIGF